MVANEFMDSDTKGYFCLSDNVYIVQDGIYLTIDYKPITKSD